MMRLLAFLLCAGSIQPIFCVAGLLQPIKQF